ncbi:MAG: dephospho-CoA kinase [Candidatus Kapaibacteriota bacterium]
MKKSFQQNKNFEKNIKIVAITGSIGSGKSTVAKFIEEMGYPVIKTDDLAKIVMLNDKEVKRKLIQEFGENIYDKNGVLDSKLLSSIVFDKIDTNHTKLAKLNRIIHPVVIEQMIIEIEKFVQMGEALIFVESALIYETGLDEGFDYIIDVDCKEELRIKRTAERLKLSEEEIRNRDSVQLSAQVKKKLADFVIENNNNLEKLRFSTEFVIEMIKMA